MAKKEFKILLALNKQDFAKKVLYQLRKTYTIHLARTLKQFSHQVHKYEFDLVIIDYQFCGMKAEDVYQGIEMLHPNALFVIYTQRHKKDLAMKVWKRRALDYISYTSDIYSFCEEVNKCVRWLIQRTEVTTLGKKIDDLAHSITEIGRKIEKSL